MADLDYTKGSIWWTNLSKYFGSSVQGGFRPVVIVSSTAGCMSSDIVTVCPLTTKLKDLSVNVSIKPFVSGKPQQALTNQLVTIPKANLSNLSGYVDKEDMDKIQQGILISLGILKPIVDRAKASQEALLQIRKDKEALDNLIPQAKEIASKLNELLARSGRSRAVSTSSRRYLRRSEEEIRDFMKEWEDSGNNRNEVAQAFGFNSYGAAYSFWLNHKKRVK